LRHHFHGWGGYKIGVAMLYEFQCGRCGHVGAAHYGILDAPSIGERHAEPCPTCRCADYRRIVSLPVVNSEYQAARNKYPYVSRRWSHLEGCERVDGHPIIESVAHEKEVMARNGMVRE
jgi:hypothetical protein